MQSRFTLRLPVLTVAAAVTVAINPAHADAPDAGIISATGGTQVYLNPNGVPVVNIADPNAAGVSHNQYSQFNVDARGAVLNNGTIDQLSRNSQLAGQTFANANLTSSAKLILNEVTSANRSVLAGYTEVLGQQADVIIANPFGVTCDGCGFLNTPRVTLTTGSANFNGNGGIAGVLRERRRRARVGRWPQRHEPELLRHRHARAEGRRTHQRQRPARHDRREQLELRDR